MTIDSISAAGTPKGAARAFGAAEAAPLQSAARPAGAPSDHKAVAQDEAPAPTREQLSQAISKLNRSSQANAQGLEFSLDEDTQRTVVKVVDLSTREVLRQIPTPEALELAKSLDRSKGLLISQTA